MEAAEKEHRENLNAMEFKFFKEKVTSRVWSVWISEVMSQIYQVLWTFPQARLEREAEEQIALVVERAHNEAVLWEDFLSIPLICTLSVPKKKCKEKIIYLQEPLCMERKLENKS